MRAVDVLLHDVAAADGLFEGWIGFDVSYDVCDKVNIACQKDSVPLC